MTLAQNVETYRRWFDEGWNKGHADLADQLYAPAYVTHSLPPEYPPTLEGLKKFLRDFREGMPDLNFTLEDTVVEGDRVVGRFTARGTHTGTLFGIPATGKQATVGAIIIARFDDSGKWVEDWANFDQLGLLTQLGAIPAPAMA